MPVTKGGALGMEVSLGVVITFLVSKRSTANSSSPMTTPPPVLSPLSVYGNDEQELLFLKKMDLIPPEIPRVHKQLHPSCISGHRNFPISCEIF